jgi:hypothetical protein
MAKRRLVGVLGCVFAGLLGGASRIGAQETVAECGVAPVGERTAQLNIFSEQQEIWLGRLEAELAESQMPRMRDQALSAHLQGIADRLAKTLPATSIRFQVTLVDSDEVNGFSLAGGHIYILRKLAAVAQNDDELAGVIGHEMGHIASHQFAFDTTREMRRLLQVTSVGDEADLRTKYEALMDAEYKDKHPELGETDAEQAEADQIGLYAMAAAGYRPEAYSEFWNRVFFVQGKTGSKLGDLLGLTKPSERRLRSIAAMVAALPKGCGSGAKPERESFAAWHAAVVANQRGVEVASTAALSETTLTPPLRLELERVKFSPDGTSILAQDEGSIFVLNREPLTMRYRIDASGALEANFSPDSKKITFTTPGLHVEEWSVAEGKLISAREMLPKQSCYDPRLSPDGRTMVCVELEDETIAAGLALLDTTSSAVLWEKKGWAQRTFELELWLRYLRLPYFASSYSADGNTLLFAGGDALIAFDLRSRSVIKMGIGMRDTITGGYAFIGNDRVAAVNPTNQKSSPIYSFPDGKVLQKVVMPFTDVRSVTQPGTALRVLAYGVKEDAVSLADLGTVKLLAEMKFPALDEYDGMVAAEAAGGALVLAPLGMADAKLQTRVDLPLSPLPNSPVAALSADGRYLALSTRRRGGIWDLSTGARVGLLKGFTDATWDEDDVLFMDVAKDGPTERHIAQVKMATKSVSNLTYKVDDETHMRFGRLTDWKQDEKKKTWTLSMYEPATDKLLWSRNFPDKSFSYTASYGNRDLIFNFKLDSHVAKDALNQSAALSEEANAVKKKDEGRLIEVLDGRTGEKVGSLVVELPLNYAGTEWLNRAGDLLYVQGVDDRTSVYSMATGKRVRELIGYVRAVDAETGRVMTGNRIGEGVVYDSEGKELAHYQLGDPIRFALFREGAKVVTILTADQKVRTMQVGN